MRSPFVFSIGYRTLTFSFLSLFVQPDLTAKFRNPETILFCQRVMVGVIILYDHVHHQGAFSKKNPSIDVSCLADRLLVHQQKFTPSFLLSDPRLDQGAEDA